MGVKGLPGKNGIPGVNVSLKTFPMKRGERIVCTHLLLDILFP